MAVKEANFYMDEDNWSHRTPFVVLDTPAGPTWHLGDPGADHMETWKDIIFGNTNPVVKDFVMPKIQKGEDWTNTISQGDVNKGSLDGEDFMEVHAPGAWVDRPEWPGLEGQIKKHYLDNWNKNPIKDIRFQREAKVASDVEDIMKQFDDMGIFDKMPDVAPGPKKVYDPQAEMAHYNEPDSMMQYAEHVPIEWLRQYREFNRRPNEEHGTEPARYEAIKNHIEQHGITAPLGLEYDPDVGEAYLGEGNTRLNIAEDLGYTHVPLTVFRRVKRDAYHPWKPMGQPGQYITDQYGGFPEYSRPSELGIPTRQARTAAISKNKNKFHTGTIDHMRSLAKRGPLKTHKKDKKAAIDPNHLQEYINKYGPYMYHSTPPENVPSILENGILPKEETGTSYYGWGNQPELASRPNHVYIGDEPVVQNHFGPILKVDLRKLDPNLIDTDEDYVQFKGRFHVKAPDELPGYNQIRPWSEDRARRWPGAAPSLGEHMENHSQIIDQPHWTRESLYNGSVAVRGGIPADAIEVNEKYKDHPFDLYQPGGPPVGPIEFYDTHPNVLKHVLKTPPQLNLFNPYVYEKASKAEHDGAMVAVYIPKAQAEKLHLDGGELAEDLHITLAFFEDKAKDRDDWEKAQEIVEQVVREFPPLEGEITGTGRFQTDESEPFIGLVSIHGITALHDKLVVELTDGGFPISTKFAYNPHITLKYMDKDTDDPDFDAELPLKIRFDSATFVVNDKRHEADFDPKASVDLSKPILASRNDRTRADFSKASKFATFGCPNCGGQEFGFGAQCRRCKEFVVTAKRDPDYMFAYYQSGLEVQEYDHNLRYRNILEDLLKRFDMTTNDTGWQDNEHLWTGGEIFRISPKAKFKVKFKQLADPEVQEQALKAIKKHFKAREIQHDLDIDINDKLEEKESATQQLPLDKFAMPTDPAVISQLRYRLSQPSWGGHVLEAYINNNKVGEIVVDSDGIISSINSWMPRRGIATEMLNELDRRGVKWEHSTSFSDSGKGLYDSLHLNEETKWAPGDEGEWERLSMALTPRQWENWKKETGGKLYHYTNEENLPDILTNGIKPWDEVGKSIYEHTPDLVPRPGHVYMTTYPRRSLHFDPQTGGSIKPILEIDMNHLDPSRVNMDEDWGHHYMDENHPAYKPYWESPNTGESGGSIVNNHSDYFDDPLRVNDSMEQHGSVAYHGAIPPHAIKVHNYIGDDGHNFPYRYDQFKAIKTYASWRP